MAKIDDLLNIFDEEMIPVPSGLLLHCANPTVMAEIIEMFSKHYSERCKAYTDALIKTAGEDFEYGMLPSENPEYEIAGTDIKIIFNKSGYNLFSIDYGRNLPPPDAYEDFDEVIKQTIAVVKQKYPDVKAEGLFAWNYNNGIDYMNFSMKICDGGRNKYAVKLLETALDEEGIDCEEYFE